MARTIAIEARTMGATGVTSVGFDWTMALGCLWLLGGIYLDAWAHLHVPGPDTFFTPWHGVMYSGLLATTALAVWGATRGRTLPAGYHLSLGGAAIFLAGGVFDLIWHTVFGIESSVEALFSPPHLVLGFGSGLILTGPLRAAWHRPRPGEGGWALQGPMVFSLASLVATLSFWTQYLHPINRPWPALGNRPIVAVFPVAAPDPNVLGGGIPALWIAQSSGVASIVLQTAITMGVMLFALERFSWRFPAGTFTVALTLNALLMAFLKDQPALVPFAAVAGIVADLLLVRLRPSSARTGALRAFAFAVPAVYYLLYFLTIAATKGTWWAAQVWVGSIVLAGITGWLLTYLLVPPGPERAAEIVVVPGRAASTRSATPARGPAGDESEAVLERAK